MVKLKIRNDDVEDEVKIPELTFYLHLEDSGDLCLRANDNIDNSQWEILSITPEGKYILSTDISSTIGLQVTNNGCIRRE